MVRAGCVFVAGIHPSRTWTSGSFESVRWNACVLRLDLGLYSHPKEFWGEWSLNPCWLQGKNPLYQKMSPEEDRTRDAVDSEPKHYQLSYSGPHRPSLLIFSGHWIQRILGQTAVDEGLELMECGPCSKRRQFLTMATETLFRELPDLQQTSEFSPSVFWLDKKKIILMTRVAETDMFWILVGWVTVSGKLKLLRKLGDKALSLQVFLEHPSHPLILLKCSLQFPSVTFHVSTASLA